MKANTPAFQQMYLSLKIGQISLSSYANKNVTKIAGRV